MFLPQLFIMSMNVIQDCMYYVLILMTMFQFLSNAISLCNFTVFSVAFKISLNRNNIHSLWSMHPLSHVLLTFYNPGTYNQNVQVLEVDSLAPTQSLTGHIGTVTSVCASPSGQFAVTCCYDGKMRVKFPYSEVKRKGKKWLCANIVQRKKK